MCAHTHMHSKYEEGSVHVLSLYSNSIYDHVPLRP